MTRKFAAVASSTIASTSSSASRVESDSLCRGGGAALERIATSSMAYTPRALILEAEFSPQQACAGAQRLQLALGDVAGQGRHAAVGAGLDAGRVDMLHGLAQGVRDLLGSL